MEKKIWLVRIGDTNADNAPGRIRVHAGRQGHRDESIRRSASNKADTYAGANRHRGKTVYIVDTKYANTRPFINELHKILQERYPKTTWVLRDKIGMYMDDDPKLWEEIKAKGAAAIVAIGH